MGAIVVFLGLKVFISDDSQFFSAVIMRKSLKREAAIKKKTVFKILNSDSYIILDQLKILRIPLRIGT